MGRSAASRRRDRLRKRGKPRRVRRHHNARRRRHTAGEVGNTNEHPKTSHTSGTISSRGTPDRGKHLRFPVPRKLPDNPRLIAPEEAVKALVAAAKDESRAELEKITRGYSKLLSGDPVEDKKDMDDFAAALQENAQLLQVDASKYTVTAGKNNWPAPIPVIQKDGKWFLYQGGAGRGFESPHRRERASAIETCRAYAVAQWEYYTQGD